MIKGQFYTEMKSPVGLLTLIAGERGLCGLLWESDNTTNARKSSSHHLLDETKRQLGEYFEGKRCDFDLPLAPEGTVFQLKVWKVLRGISYGETISYSEQAKRLGNPKSVRAVGGANGRNPISIIVPCHRVIGKGGSLTGFGGGLPNKKFLLELEQATLIKQLGRSVKSRRELNIPIISP